MAELGMPLFSIPRGAAHSTKTVIKTKQVASG